MKETAKEFAKELIPPFFLKIGALLSSSLADSPQYGWFGDYASWQHAQAESTGYDSGLILEKVKNALLKVKNGEAVYERDSVLFNSPHYSWPIVAALLWVAAQNKGNLNIIDFGGSLGSTYFQNRSFLKNLERVSWNIVEQELFVACGKQLFQTKELTFHAAIDDLVVGSQRPNAILLSSVLPYLPQPYDFLEKVYGYGFKHIIIDRTFFLPGDTPHRITVHKVDPVIYEASIPTHVFNEIDFLHHIQRRYNLVAEFDCNLNVKLSDKKMMYSKGYICQQK